MPRGSMIGRAVQLMEAVAELGHDPSAHDIATETRLPLQSVHRTLRALSDEQLLVFDRLERNYSLGSRSLRFAAAILRASPLDRLARPVMRSLMRETQAAVTLNELRPQDGAAVVLAVDETRKPWRFAPEPGEIESLCGTAAGKAILAFLPAAEMDVMIARHRRLAAGNRTTGATVLKRELAAIRRAGVAFSTGDGVNPTCIAAPVRDAAGRVIGSLAVSVAEPDFSVRHKARWQQAVKAHAAQLSSLLGHLSFPATVVPLHAAVAERRSRRPADLPRARPARASRTAAGTAG
jgi:IclR family acetate operon transcriptional repressor